MKREAEGDFCWVQTGEKTQKRPLTLSDSNDVFIVVEQGLKEGDKVVLNPIAMLKEAEALAQSTINSSSEPEQDQAKPEEETSSQ